MLTVNPQKQIKKIKEFIKKTLKRTGFKKVILALSGGVDSSTTLLLLTQALGPENILVAKLPLAKQGMKDADKMIKLANIPQKNILEIDITPIVTSIKKATKTRINQVRLGNIMARIRMILLYDLAKKHQALVCGTENRSEYLLGYFTLFGDQASDLEPLKHLYKTQVKQLAQFLKVPREIIDKPPTAGLWPGQTDEKELGFSYQEADQILHLVFDKKVNLKEMVKRGFEKRLVLKVLKRVKENLFKHQLPYQL